MGEVAVRRAGVSDLDAAARLFTGYLRFYEKATPEAEARNFISQRLKRRDSWIYLASVEGSEVGFMQLYPTFASLSLAPSWILNDLFVEPEARGHGVGQALMVTARELAVVTGAAELMLQTARTNTTAQRLYEKLGWKRDDEFLVYTLNPKAPT
jgi:GNAT superfamily N-acetyltransferase